MFPEAHIFARPTATVAATAHGSGNGRCNRLETCRAGLIAVVAKPMQDAPDSVILLWFVA